MTTRITARDGTSLAVHELGQGPPLLCIPGGPGRASSYLGDLGRLHESRTLLMLDTRGTGESELPADRASLQFPRLADDVEDVRAALSLERVDLLGHSAGCPVALTYAARHSDRVRSLVLVTPSGMVYGWTPEDLDGIRAGRADEPWFAAAAAAVADLETVGQRFRRELERETRPFWYGRWDDATRAHAAAADHEVSLRANAGYPPGPDYDVAAARASLASVAAPTLVIVGERDALTGVSVAERFADAMPSVEVARIPAAGHFPWVDEPDCFATAVETFLAPPPTCQPLSTP